VPAGCNGANPNRREWVASIKNKIARSKVHRANRKATNKARRPSPLPQHRLTKPVRPSLLTMWLLGRGMTDKVPKRFLALR